MRQRARTDEAKERRRRALLDAALEVFFERGLSAARMEDVAARAGLSKGTLYLYFASKEALFAALIDDVVKPNIDRAVAAIASAPTADGAIGRLAALAPWIIRETPMPKVVKIMIGDAVAFPEIVKSYRAEVVERVLGALVGMLTAARDRGELAVRDPETTARLVIAPVLLAAIWRVLFERPEALADGAPEQDLDGYFAEHARLLMRALAPEGRA